MSAGHLLLVVVVVVAALGFDFINGFHDAANSIATIVSTRVLTPFRAVLWAAFFNFIAFALFKLHVASTIGKGIIDPAVVDMAVIIGALAGAIAWNLLTWWWGLPSSSSHALVGGLIGAGVSKAGLGILGWSKIGATAAFILISPLLGYFGAASLMVGCSWLLRKQTPGRVDRWFRRLQFLSASAFSLNLGGNDAQKTMGMRLTKLRPFGGFCAETGGSLAIFIATQLGIPVSTTHTITGAIVGVGSVSNPGRVRWGLASRILWAWIFTIPVSALIAAITYFIARALGA